ncbi:FadR/GntR family transcriptional regulator [Haematobacter massiliensis]|uniref:FadR/GntR family transcriptional regulator n=2 Tax=Haematobacter massiliensis TaxID=195105 RepID=UPI00068A4F36|nr:FadR/GntR family transcriptional regulator [Haematobacter massiliensis]
MTRLVHMKPVPAEKASGSSTYALERLRRYIDDLMHQPGARLPTERQLVVELGIGRRAVRRALEVLEAEGLIRRKQGAGTFVGGFDPLPEAARDLVTMTDLLEIMEVRLRLEPQLAQLAALRARPEQVSRMRVIVERIRDYQDPDEGELWDGALHRLIAQAAGNTLFLSLFDIVNRIRQDDAWQRTRDQMRSETSRAPIFDQHSAVVKAIADRDPVAAGEAMRDHLMFLQNKLIGQTFYDAALFPETQHSTASNLSQSLPDGDPTP